MPSFEYPRYKVPVGATAAKIAEDHLVPVEEFCKINKQCEKLQAGQQVYIPFNAAAELNARLAELETKNQKLENQKLALQKAYDGLAMQARWDSSLAAMVPYLIGVLFFAVIGGIIAWKKFLKPRPVELPEGDILSRAKRVQRDFPQDHLEGSRDISRRK